MRYVHTGVEALAPAGCDDTVCVSVLLYSSVCICGAVKQQPSLAIFYHQVIHNPGTQTRKDESS